MEWVETTGRTIEEAKDAALDQLGVDETDAEFDIVDQAKAGLFGLTRREARVRARVKPTSPRPKVERRDRHRKGKASADKAPASRRGDGQADGARSTKPRKRSDGDRDGRPARSRDGGARRQRDQASAVSATDNGKPPEGNQMSVDDATVEDQAEIITEFLGGLVEAFGFRGEIDQVEIDDETIELQVVGDDLGLLIGPKGQTLMAIQDLSRTVVQRQAAGTHHGRVRLDVGGYRQRRREALERFATSIANDVLASGVPKTLEPMNAADRKVVHDTVNDIDGVRTESEGEDQRRRVVISPDD